MLTNRLLKSAFFLSLIVPTIACAGASHQWNFQMEAPNVSMHGQMSLSQSATRQGWILDASTVIKQGAELLANLKSRLHTRPNGSALDYRQEESLPGGGAFQLNVRVQGRKISGSLRTNGRVVPLHYRINGSTPEVYLLGNNLLNGFQAMLYGLNGDHPQTERVLYPSHGLWLRGVLQPGKTEIWKAGGQRVLAVPIALRLLKSGRPIVSVTLWCTPAHHFLLAMDQGMLSITRRGMPRTTAQNDHKPGPLPLFSTANTKNVSVLHTHLTLLGRDMAGTLTLPRNRPLRGAILLIPGSGPTNADGNNPLAPQDFIYKQLAYDLAKGGYAMLRYNKASISPATEAHSPPLTLQSYAQDAAAWFSWMQNQGDLRGSRMILMGHSMGGLVSLYAVNHGLIHPQRVVLLESPGAPLGSVLSSQLVYQAKLLDESQYTIGRLRKDTQILVTSIRTAKGVTLHLPSSFLGAFPLAEFFTCPGCLPLAKSEFAAHPAQLMRSIHVPVLIVQGGKDIQVLPWNGRMLKAANRRYATLLNIPDLSHSLTAVKSEKELLNPAPPGRYLDAAMIHDIENYLRTH